jgi:hypothetical protein
MATIPQTYVERAGTSLPCPLPRYTDPNAMQIVIDKYFDSCAERELPATVTGLALALGFSDRQSLILYGSGEIAKSVLDVETRQALANTVKRAKARIEDQAETRLYQGKVNPIGTIFSLKNNFGWIDRQETTGPNVTIQIASFDPSVQVARSLSSHDAISGNNLELSSSTIDAANEFKGLELKLR